MPEDSIWLRPERAGHGPAPEHSRAQIAATAVELADQGGLGAVSMRKVATALNTGAASLYRYVATRDELIALMSDAVTGELGYPRPTTGNWRADIIAIAHGLRGLYARHPWMLEVHPGSTAVGPNGVAYLEQSLAALSPLESSPAAKLEATAMLSGSVSLFARNADVIARNGAAAQAATIAYLGSVVAAGTHPHLAAALAAAPAREAADPDTLFDRVIIGLISGLLAVPSE